MATRVVITGILNPQHIGALFRKAAVDLATALTANMEQAFAKGKVTTVATMDVQGAFDTLLCCRLIHNLRKQG